MASRTTLKLLRPDGAGHMLRIFDAYATPVSETEEYKLVTSKAFQLLLQDLAGSAASPGAAAAVFDVSTARQEARGAAHQRVCPCGRRCKCLVLCWRRSAGRVCGPAHAAGRGGRGVFHSGAKTPRRARTDSAKAQ